MSSTSLSPGEQIWRFQAGSSDGYDVAYAVAADAGGDFFIAGYTSGSLDGVAVNAGGYDFAVAKISGMDGSVIWWWQAGASGDDALGCAAATDDGGVVVGGYSNGTYNSVPSEGLVDFIAIKFDADGVVEWLWQEGTIGNDYVNSCSKTTDGNVVLTGSTAEDWQVASSGSFAMIAVKLDASDGAVIWRYQAAASTDDSSSFAAASRADGSIVLAGFSEGTWVGKSVVGITDFAAVALDEDGAELWRYQSGVVGASSVVQGVAALADGSVVLAGATDGGFDGNVNAGGSDFVVIKLSADGEVEWTRQDGTNADDQFRAVATGVDGTSVVFAGSTYGTWWAPHEGTEEFEDFVGMSMDADGTVLWRYQSGTPAGNDFRDVAVRPTDGAALLVGWTHDDWVSGEFNVFSKVAAVLLETGAVVASTPPAPGPTPATGGSCGATESFLVTSADLPEIQGCYQATELSFATGSITEVWSVSGDIGQDQVVIGGNADDGTGEWDDTPYLIYFSMEEGDGAIYCLSVEDAITVHPVDASWKCDLGGTGEYEAVTDGSVSFECGCSPSPLPPPTPPSPAPSTTPTVAAKEGSSTPLGLVIGGSVGGAGLLAIVGIVACWRHRTAMADRNFGKSSSAAATGFPAVSSDGAAAGKGDVGSRPRLSPPPAYSEPSPPTANMVPPGNDLPPPPAYSEPPAYSGE